MTSARTPCPHRQGLGRGGSGRLLACSGGRGARYCFRTPRSCGQQPARDRFATTHAIAHFVPCGAIGIATLRWSGSHP
jgi:hypothetical protein